MANLTFKFSNYKSLSFTSLGRYSNKWRDLLTKKKNMLRSMERIYKSSFNICQKSKLDAVNKYIYIYIYILHKIQVFSHRIHPGAMFSSRALSGAPGRFLV